MSVSGHKMTEAMALAITVEAMNTKQADWMNFVMTPSLVLGTFMITSTRS